MNLFVVYLFLSPSQSIFAASPKSPIFTINPSTVEKYVAKFQIAMYDFDAVQILASEFHVVSSFRFG